MDKIAASLFSTRLFKALLSKRYNAEAKSRLLEIRAALRISSSTNEALVRQAYCSVERRYRTEYYYKNAIANELFAKAHGYRDVAMLQEVRIASAVADCILINGSGVVYEIKTEFDSTAKLASQIPNYYKAFPLVSCVVPEDRVQVYRNHLEGSTVGLACVGNRGEIVQVKNPIPKSDCLESQVLFNMLRVREVEEVIVGLGRDVPVVPNGLRYVAYRNCLNDIPVETLQQLVQSTLRKRSRPTLQQPLVDPVLAPLRSIVVELGLDTSQYHAIRTWLKQSEV
jgi:hypothetical protein